MTRNINYEKMAKSFNEKYDADKTAGDMKEIMKESAEAGARGYYET